MNKKQKQTLVRILVSFALLVGFSVLKIDGYLKFALFLIPYVIIGYDIIKKAIWGIFHGEIFDENFLMAVATIGAIIVGDYAEGTAVMLFYQVGELFQSYAVGKSRKNITDLMDIRPDYANIEKDGKLVQIDPDEVELGSIIVVQPGEKIPLDGIVTEGKTSKGSKYLSLVLQDSSGTVDAKKWEVLPGDEKIFVATWNIANI